MERRILLLLLALALAGCGSASSPSGPAGSGYEPPPRQRPVLPDSLNIHGCSSTTMGGSNVVSVCDPQLLERAWENGTPNRRGDLDVRIAGRKLRVASTPGLTQVIPDDGIGSLLVPAKVTLEGKTSDGSYLYISARSEKPDHVAWGEALFRHLGLEHGIATIDVELDDEGAVRFVLRRPDGSVLEPLRVSHHEGPGPSVALPPLPDRYADTPEQGVRTYVAAINARDGKTICQLFTSGLQRRFHDDRTPCWALATGLIDYGSESDSPVFERLELLDVGRPFERTSRGRAFTGVPVSVRSHVREGRYSTKREVHDHETTVWFRRTGEGWRIAKDPFFTSSEDADAPPGAPAEHAPESSRPQKPSREELQRAAKLAKEARARAARAKAAEKAREAAAWARTLVRFDRGRVACDGRSVRVADAASEVVVQRVAAGAGAPKAALRAAADIRSVSLAMSGRHVCFSVAFARQPFLQRRPTVGIEIGLGLTYWAKRPLSVHQAGFGIETNTVLRNGRTYAGLGSTQPPLPAAAHAELHGNTLVADFDLDASFPALRPSQLANLTWGLDISVVDFAGATPTASFHDQVPNNPHPLAPVASPEVRQSDGKVVIPG